jgi:hypothetical protein
LKTWWPGTESNSITRPRWPCPSMASG